VLSNSRSLETLADMIVELEPRASYRADRRGLRAGLRSTALPFLPRRHHRSDRDMRLTLVVI
jgi:hypothetical protein